MYSLLSFLSVLLFALVHLLAEKSQKFSWKRQGKLLSFGGGVAISYVFVDLLPKLAKNEELIKNAFSGTLPYFEKHVYVAALLGFLLFFFVDQSKEFVRDRARFWLSLSSYALFNFFVGYAVGDPTNPEVQPLALFTLAIALHYFVNDFSMSREHPHTYDAKARWILIAALLCGWAVSEIVAISASAVALISAFIGGGVIMNVTRHEVPKTNPHNTAVFITAALAYALLLLPLK